MATTLDQFASACHDILKTEPGVAGRRKLCSLLQDLLRDEAFLAAHLVDSAPERRILYEDPELGFCIVAHVYPGAKESAPHDHGPTWAIYGQARGETEMIDWEVIEPGSEKTPAKVRPVKSYRLTPGMAYLYNEGDVHSPRRTGPTRLLRIEGLNTDKIQRRAFQPG